MLCFAVEEIASALFWQKVVSVQLQLFIFGMDFIANSYNRKLIIVCPLMYNLSHKAGIIENFEKRRNMQMKRRLFQFYGTRYRSHCFKSMYADS